MYIASSLIGYNISYAIYMYNSVNSIYLYIRATIAVNARHCYNDVLITTRKNNINV